jgi:uncharacterized membrane protein YkoI
VAEYDGERIFMRTFGRTLGAAILATAVCSGIYAWADDDNADALKKAPQPVQDMVKQVVGDNKLEGCDTEQLNGKTVYEVDYKVKGGDYSISVTPAGEIVEREVEVDLSIVPPSVLDAAKAAHADGKIGEASIVTAGDNLVYELDVKTGKDTHEMQISPTGKVTADAVEPPEADEKGGDKD